LAQPEWVGSQGCLFPGVEQDIAKSEVMMRTFPAQENRVESGAIRFGDDWPGLFLRGDDAFMHASSIQIVVRELVKRYGKENVPLDMLIAIKELAGLADTIRGEVDIGKTVIESLSDEVATIIQGQRT
jgi:hypothetical protein